MIQIGKSDYVIGIPKMKPFIPPEGCERWRLRFRNTDWGIAFCRIGGALYKFILKDKGDHFEADTEIPQALNVREKR